MAPETLSCEENRIPRTSGKDLTKLLLDLSESALTAVPAKDPYLCPWVEERQRTLHLPPSRKKRARKRKPNCPVAEQGPGFFFSNDTLVEESHVTYPTCHMNSYISYKNRPVFDKPGKMPPLHRPEYRLSSREQPQRASLDTARYFPQSGEKSILSLQAPCLLNKSSLAWSGSTDPLPQLAGRKHEDTALGNSDEEVVLLLKSSREFYTNHSAREVSTANHGAREVSTANRIAERIPFDVEVVYGKLLPCVRNCRDTWNWRTADKTSARSHQDPNSPVQGIRDPPQPSYHQHRAEVFTRSSSAASSRSSTIIGTDFKGKLQSTLHRSSDSCFKKLPCGLVYGKSLRGVRLRGRTNSRNTCVDLCVRPV
ncbi:hypothetical protein ACHWQZ_G003593 [Mnemiopsis leidyi]